MTQDKHDERLEHPETAARPRPPETGDTPPPSPPPPKAVSRKLLALIGATFVVALIIGSKLGPRVGKAADDLLHAFQDDDGDDQAQADGTTYYTCGMHPWVLLPEPGLCPICHMDLTPVDPAKFTGEVAIDPVVTQNIGVRIAEVVNGSGARAVRTVGSIEYDETTVRDINTKIAGWVETLHVDALGAAVRRGDPVFSLYSPELVSAQEEYLLALKTGRKGLIDAARTRLKYFDVGDAQIRALEKRGRPRKTITLTSPHDGVVIAKHANEGMRVEPGMQVYRIADVSKVWVMVTLYEQQAAFAEKGRKATMTLPYLPGQTFEGEIVHVYPYMDERTRQVNVRLEFDNPDGLLKPGMFATVELEGEAGPERVLAPRQAVIDTGERQVAFVSRGEGRFEPRDVRMGASAGDGMVEILEGLEPGEKVVTSGQFLLDSEAKMREALAKMIRGDLAADQAPEPDAPAGDEPVAALSDEAAQALTRALDASLAIQDTLASDGMEGVGAQAGELAAGLEALTAAPLPGQPHFWHQHPEVAKAADDARAMADMTDIEAARSRFKTVSEALVTVVQATGVPESYPKDVQLLHCPMYQGGAHWLQAGGPTRNPYYGSTMLACADSRQGLARQ